MFMIPVLDWFDQWYERHAVKVGIYDPIPDKAVVFGSFKDVRYDGIAQYCRFIRIKIPILTTWGPVWPPKFTVQGMEQGFRRHVFWWIEGTAPGCGCRIEPPLEG